MRALCMKGQSRVHFTQEGPRRRSEILNAISATPVEIDIYDATAIGDKREARTRCLQLLVVQVAASGGRRLVLEQDDSLVLADQADLYSAVRAADAEDRLSYEHLPARSEPLLWIPDAAAWCWARGGSWQSRIRERVRDVHRL